MAFCPNCGTPNTDQAEKCVSCGFELAATKAKPKFKGTIMMQSVQLPGHPKPAAPKAATTPPPAEPPPPASPSAAPGKNLGFAKTMMGGVGMGPGFPPAGSFATRNTSPPAQGGGFAAPPAPKPSDLSRAATMEGPRPSSDLRPMVLSPTEPGSTQPSASPAASPSGGFAAPPPSGVGGFSPPGSASSGGFGASSGGFANAPSTGGFGNTGGGFGNTGGFGNSMPPVAAKSNTTKVIAIGCAAALVLSCVVAGLLYSMMKDKVAGMLGSSSAKDGAALEWRGSLATALVQVSALCQSDCPSASVYFHPDVQEALLVEAKQLSTLRATKLADPGQSQAQMLGDTDDASIAEKLQLDPAQCVRVVSGEAKVVGCSVPTPGGQPNLRIVYMAGIGTL